MAHKAIPLTDLPSREPIRSTKIGTAAKTLGKRISRVLSECIGQSAAEARKKVEHVCRNHDTGLVTRTFNELTTGVDSQYAIHNGTLYASKFPGASGVLDD